MHKGLTALENLQADAALLRQYAVPMLLLVSRSDCAYCAEVRNNYLLPLARASAPATLLLRELESDQVQTLRDLDGQPRAVGNFLQAMKVNFFPTVLFLDETMQPLTDPLRGLDQAGFYGAYLEQHIQQASSALRRRHAGLRKES
jgi:hypothetical protein